MSTVIKVENLSKKYTISHQRQERYTALRDVITNIAKGLFNRGIVQPFKRLSSNSTILEIPNSTVQQFSSSTHEDFYALRDVSFEIKQGDRVGIIGRNGAGKSTLLKILSRITEPTSGRIEITGRVASLLEVGTGFHPELTGRENIFLNGAILGMSKWEIKKKFDEIVAFAEIEKFLDTPVKRYSSGMYVRLAFAVAAHLEPEILIVDEVLAVGDAQFQKKCLGKMEEVGKEGRTVLFVSHNMGAIQTLCTRCLILDNGKLSFDQLPNKAIQRYLEETGCSNSFVRSERVIGKPTIVSAQIKMIDENVEAKVTLYVEIQSDAARHVGLDLRLTDGVGRPVGYGSLGAFNEGELVLLQIGKTLLTLSFPACHLAEGTYYISMDLTTPDVEYFDKADNCLSFELVRAPDKGARRVLSQAWGYGSVELALKVLENKSTMLYPSKG